MKNLEPSLYETTFCYERFSMKEAFLSSSVKVFKTEFLLIMLLQNFRILTTSSFL